MCVIGGNGRNVTEHTAVAFALLLDRHFSAVFIKDEI